MKELNSAAASFVRVYDEHYEDIQSCLVECGRSTWEIEDQKFWKQLAVVGLLLYEVSVIYFCVKVYFTPLISMIAGALPLLYFFKDIRNEKRCVDTVNMCVKQLMGMISLLNTELEEVKRLCEKLRSRGLGRSDRVRLMRLEQSVLEVFLLTEELMLRASAESVAQVRQEYRKTISELENIKVQLSFYTRK